MEYMEGINPEKNEQTAPEHAYAETTYPAPAMKEVEHREETVFAPMENVQPKSFGSFFAPAPLEIGQEDRAEPTPVPAAPQMPKAEPTPAPTAPQIPPKPVESVAYQIPRQAPAAQEPPAWSYQRPVQQTPDYSQQTVRYAYGYQQLQQAPQVSVSQEPQGHYYQPYTNQTDPRQTAAPIGNTPYGTDPALDQQDQIRQPKPKKKAKNKSGKRSFWKTAVCAVLILALVAGSCFATAYYVDSLWQQRLADTQEAFDQQIEDLEEKIKDAAASSRPIISGTPSASTDGLTPAQVYALNVDSVVMIRNQITSYGQTGYSTGSGFILTEDGYVVTNHHVIDGGGQLVVITTDGQEHPAKLIGSDSTNDVALLKIEAKGLQAVTLGSSDELVVGDQVVAIGNPLGELTSTLTVGYVSAKERDVNTDGFAINMLQTDAAINSGNSGGPLFNMRGEVVGITTAKYSGTSSGGATIEGVGFAIPINDVNGLLSDLATYGYVTGAYLGVKVSDMDADAANYYGMPVGAYVQSAEEGSAAQRAGIRSKDIIVKLGDYEIGSVNDLTRALRNFKGGDVTTVVVFRSGAEMELTITLDDKPVS